MVGAAGVVKTQGSSGVAEQERSRVRAVGGRAREGEAEGGRGEARKGGRGRAKAETAWRCGGVRAQQCYLGQQMSMQRSPSSPLPLAPFSGRALAPTLSNPPFQSPPLAPPTCPWPTYASPVAMSCGTESLPVASSLMDQYRWGLVRTSTCGGGGGRPPVSSSGSASHQAAGSRQARASRLPKRELAGHTPSPPAAPLPERLPTPPKQSRLSQRQFHHHPARLQRDWRHGRGAAARGARDALPPDKTPAIRPSLPIPYPPPPNKTKQVVPRRKGRGRARCRHASTLHRAREKDTPHFHPQEQCARRAGTS